MISFVLAAVLASWYSSADTCRYNPEPSCPTASGTSLYRLEKNLELFAASNYYSLNSKVKVMNVHNGKSVIVTILDRGGFEKYGRSIDLGKLAFSKIADLKEGVIKVEVREK